MNRKSLIIRSVSILALPFLTMGCAQKEWSKGDSAHYDISIDSYGSGQDLLQVEGLGCFLDIQAGMVLPHLCLEIVPYVNGEQWPSKSADGDVATTLFELYDDKGDCLCQYSNYGFLSLCLDDFSYLSIYVSIAGAMNDIALSKSGQHPKDFTLSFEWYSPEIEELHLGEALVLDGEKPRWASFCAPSSSNYRFIASSSSPFSVESYSRLPYFDNGSFLLPMSFSSIDETMVSLSGETSLDAGEKILFRFSLEGYDHLPSPISLSATVDL